VTLTLQADACCQAAKACADDEDAQREFVWW
jgi:hypothetical protein